MKFPLGRAYAPARVCVGRSSIVSDTAKALPPIEATLCNWTGCSRTSEAQLAERRLCLQHFVELSSRRMNVIRRVLDDADRRRELVSDAQDFLLQVLSQTTQLATQLKLLDPKLQERLLFLSTSAADLSTRVRHSPRLSRRTSCLLRLGSDRSDVGERCSNVNISQRGACLELPSPQRSGREITLERIDTKRSAHAKVAWVKEVADGKFLAGVEILDHEDLWGLGTSLVASTKPAQCA